MALFADAPCAPTAPSGGKSGCALDANARTSSRHMQTMWTNAFRRTASARRRCRPLRARSVVPATSPPTTSPLAALALCTAAQKALIKNLDYTLRAAQTQETPNLLATAEGKLAAASARRSSGERTARLCPHAPREEQKIFLPELMKLSPSKNVSAKLSWPESWSVCYLSEARSDHRRDFTEWDQGSFCPLLSLLSDFPITAQSTSLEVTSQELTVVFPLQECAVSSTFNPPTLSLSTSFFEAPH